MNKNSCILLVLVILVSAMPGFADLNFSSAFTGASPWNWDSATGAVGGTDALSVSFGNPTARAYLNKAVSNSAQNSSDGTGCLHVSFDVDVSALSFSAFYSGPALFEIDTPGNKGAFANGALVGISVGNWKAAPGVRGQYRFSVGTSQIYMNGASAVTDIFSPSGAEPWVYHVDMVLTIERTEVNWPVVATITVTGPSGGTTVTRTATASCNMTDGSYQGFLSVENGYYFGGLSTDAVYADSSLILDDLIVEWVPPPPLATLISLR